jgi:hypothetical protein
VRRWRWHRWSMRTRRSPPTRVSFSVPLSEDCDRGVVQGPPSFEVFILKEPVRGEAPPEGADCILCLPTDDVLAVFPCPRARSAPADDARAVPRRGGHRLPVRHQAWRSFWPGRDVLRRVRRRSSA